LSTVPLTGTSKVMVAPEALDAQTPAVTAAMATLAA